MPVSTTRLQPEGRRSFLAVGEVGGWGGRWVVDGGGYPRSILWPVDDTSPIADGLYTTPPLGWHCTREKQEKGARLCRAHAPHH